MLDIVDHNETILIVVFIPLILLLIVINSIIVIINIVVVVVVIMVIVAIVTLLMLFSYTQVVQSLTKQYKWTVRIFTERLIMCNNGIFSEKWRLHTENEDHLEGVL